MNTDPALAEAPAFPFSAILGQPQLTRALLLAAADPGLGGVLIEGPRGSAKSTAARALAALLAPAPFVTVPLGASVESVTGSLDLEQALAGHALRLAPGLLARAHGGVLYVDEINLLPDALVDVLLDAAASGVHHVERDGISHRHAARFVLVGTMNPEEGELRPQLLDRLGLAVRLHNTVERVERQAMVRARLAFDANPTAFLAAQAPAQARLQSQLQRARERLQHPAPDNALALSDEVHDAVSAHCIGAGVDGLRADLVMLRAARALAALDDAAQVGLAHVDEVAELVLAHRRRPPAEPTRHNDVSQARPQPARQAPPDQDRAEHTDSADSGDSGDTGTPNRDSAPDGSDWGALPAQPVAMLAPAALPAWTPWQAAKAKKT
ncbi:MAG: ATP-binding protein [Rubrivivax sp.]|nr:ATP-binding protein [Rubrivivax sp.]